MPQDAKGEQHSKSGPCTITMTFDAIKAAHKAMTLTYAAIVAVMVFIFMGSDTAAFTGVLAAGALAGLAAVKLFFAVNEAARYCECRLQFKDEYPNFKEHCLWLHNQLVAGLYALQATMIAIGVTCFVLAFLGMPQASLGMLVGLTVLLTAATNSCLLLFFKLYDLEACY